METIRRPRYTIRPPPRDTAPRRARARSHEEEEEEQVPPAPAPARAPSLDAFWTALTPAQIAAASRDEKERMLEENPPLAVKKMIEKSLDDSRRAEVEDARWMGYTAERLEALPSTELIALLGERPPPEVVTRITTAMTKVKPKPRTWTGMCLGTIFQVVLVTFSYFFVLWALAPVVERPQ